MNAISSTPAKRNLLVLDHPYTLEASNNVPHFRAFSSALAQHVIDHLRSKGQAVDVIDLHADGFNPVMSAQDLANWRKGEPADELTASYQQRLLNSDRLILVFPIWWELMPAMTKGFIDKVYAKSILYTQDGFKMETHLSPNFEVVAITTMGTPKLLYRTIFGKPAIKALQVGLSKKTGIRHFKWIPYSGVDKLSLEKRQELIGSLSLG